jgi:predicted HicB family RNase H-like nuclease
MRRLTRLTLAFSKKLGRPKLPKGEAKGRIVNVRLAADHLKLVEAQAKAKKQTVSEWIRSTLNAAVQQ